MSTTINVDFEKLQSCITQLQSLLNELDEPSHTKFDFMVGDATGSGLLLSHLYEFTRNTLDYHDAVLALITNTISYLNEVYKLKEADQSIADKL